VRPKVLRVNRDFCIVNMEALTLFLLVQILMFPDFYPRTQTAGNFPRKAAFMNPDLAGDMMKGLITWKYVYVFLKVADICLESHVSHRTLPWPERIFYQEVFG